MTNDFITSAKNQFEYYRLLGDITFSQLSEEQLFWKYNDERNSIYSPIASAERRVEIIGVTVDE